MLCPDCGKEKNTLPYKADEGGDNERNVCAECTIRLFRRSYLGIIKVYEEKARSALRYAEENRAYLNALNEGVAKKGEEKYIQDWLKSCES